MYIFRCVHVTTPAHKQMKINCEEALKHNVPWITNVFLSLRKGMYDLCIIYNT
jgi:hypothetical protein